MKDEIKKIAESFFISVTLINLAVFATGMLFRPAQTFGYEAFLSPLLFGFLTVIPTLVMYSKKELSVRQVLLRKLIQLILDIVIVNAVLFGGSSSEHMSVAAAIGVSVSIAAVFAAVHGISWLLARRTAKQLCEQLAAFQQRNS